MSESNATLRVSRNILSDIDEKARRIPEESLASLRAYRLHRVASRTLPVQPKAA